MRKVLHSTAVALALLAAWMAQPAAACDVDGDGVVSEADARDVLRMALGLLPQSFAPAELDVSPACDLAGAVCPIGDGRLTASDALVCGQVAAGMALLPRGWIACRLHC